MPAFSANQRTQKKHQPSPDHVLFQPLPFIKFCRSDTLRRLCPEPSHEEIEQFVCCGKRLVRHQERLVIFGICEEIIGGHAHGKCRRRKLTWCVVCRKPLDESLYRPSFDGTLRIRLEILRCMIRSQVPLFEVRVDLVDVRLRSIITEYLA